MSGWTLKEGIDGLRMAPFVRRSLGSEAFTWGDLLYSKLSHVRVFAIYFSSRFDLPVDTAAWTALHNFAEHTGSATSVNRWDPTDPEFSRAVALFHIATPPALVLAGGPKSERADEAPIDPEDLYAITLTDQDVLADSVRLAAAVNTAHEVLLRSDPREITAYIRKQSALSLLDSVGRIGAGLRDQLLLFKLKFGLPGGISLQIG